MYMPENLCIHGVDVTVKNKTLKRATTILKHSRFLRNMIVYPKFPIMEIVQAPVVQEKTEEAADQ
jgi:hypothetical protein